MPHSGNMKQTGMPTEISRVCSKHFTEGWHNDNIEDEYSQTLIFNTKSKSDAEMLRRRGNNKEILLTVSCIYVHILVPCRDGIMVVKFY